MNISETQLFNMSRRIHYDIKDRGTKYSQLIALSRGGLCLGQFLSYQLDIPLNVLSVSSYKHKLRKSTIKSSDFLVPVKGNKFLIVDDICDSGRTLDFVSDLLHKKVRGSLEIESAVLVDCLYKATYCGIRKTEKEWVYFPWDVQK